MGWGNCGTDSIGRPIGYHFEGTCDEEGCESPIHRGLEYACGGMHGTTELGCEEYFCSEHLEAFTDKEGKCVGLCPVCLTSAVWD